MKKCDNLITMRKCDLLALAAWVWDSATSYAESQACDSIVADIENVSSEEAQKMQAIFDNMIWADDADIPLNVYEGLSAMGYEF